MIDLSRMRAAFPHIDPATLPDIPNDWTDISWHNDESPSFYIGGLQIFITDGESRFVVMYFKDGETLHLTNDWTDCLAFVQSATQGQYIVDLLDRKGEVADCLYSFFPDLESAKDAARLALFEHRESRKNGVSTQCDGWSFGYAIRNPLDKVVYDYLSDI